MYLNSAGAGAMGYFTTKLNLLTRLFMIAGGIMLLMPPWQVNLIGIGVVTISFLIQKFIPQTLLPKKDL
jgi:TRAP-type uncharacterized transport system fused permease subunit